MSYSLQSRDLIADSIETIMAAQWYDACIALPGCDKNMPGCLIAMARFESARPDGVRRYDPSWQYRAIANWILSLLFSAYGQYVAGTIDDETRREHRKTCLSRGGCLRWNVYGEHDGLRYRGHGHVSTIQLASIPAEDPDKELRVPAAGQAI